MSIVKDYYQILELSPQASQAEIKKAFYKLLPSCPPEKKPEEYKLLREAFDTLFNQVSRKEYDNRRELGPEIDELNKQIDALLNGEKPDYDAAIPFLKKAVVIAPQTASFKKKLGDCFFGIENFELALTQYRKAIEIDPHNRGYRMDVVRTYRKLTKYNDAESILLDLIKEDSEDYIAPRELADMYFYNMERKEEAYKVLETSISADSKLDFQDFFCIYDLLHFYFFDDNLVKLNEELERVKKISKNAADKKYAAFMISRLARDLIDNKNYAIARVFATTAHELDMEDEDIKEFYEAVILFDQINQEALKLIDDDNVDVDIKEVVRLRVGSLLGFIDKSESEEKWDEQIDLLEKISTYEPYLSDLKKSVVYTQKHYKVIAEEFERLFEAIQDSSATQYAGRCPSCKKTVTVDLDDYGSYNCPTCGTGFDYSRGGYRKTGSSGNQTRTVSTSSSSSNPPGCVVVLFGFVLLILLKGFLG